MIPKYRIPVHPGEILLEEFILPKKISQVDLLERSRSPFSVLIH